MSRYEDFLKVASDEYLDHRRFLQVRDVVLANMEKRRSFNAHEIYGDGGFGVLAEKTMHATLKFFIEPDDNFHEVAIDGFYADICRNGKIIEIQTRRLAKLRRKLETFLAGYEVTVVYPVVVNKWRGYCENVSLRPERFRLSPLHRDEYSAFDELFGIKEFLTNPALKVHMYLLDAEEIYVKQSKVRGRKRARNGYERFESIPLGIRKIIEFNCINDYMQLIPELTGEFTSEDFARGVGCYKGTASMVLNILNHVGVVVRVGKKGNYYLYETAY